jgi:hypothetical protein
MALPHIVLQRQGDEVAIDAAYFVACGCCMQAGMVGLHAVETAAPEQNYIIRAVHIPFHMMPLRRADLIMSADLHQHEHALAVDSSLSAL